MHSNSNIENEYIFKCILFIRKALPKSDTFYILFFLCKYLPLILFSHANYSTDTNLFTLTKILRSLTVFYHNPKFHYGILCVVIYIIILCLIGSFLFLFLYFYFQSKSNDKKLYDMVTNQFEISKSIKIFIYVIVYSSVFILYFRFSELVLVFNSNEMISLYLKEKKILICSVTDNGYDIYM